LTSGTDQYATWSGGVFTFADQDSDGIPNFWERLYPETDVSVADAGDNDDGDSLTNLQEFQNRTDPGETDTDGDGLSDSAEVNLTPVPTDPLNPDSDNDGRNDGAEVAAGSSTDPMSADTDQDGMDDEYEISGGYYSYPTNTDPDNADSDNDGLSDTLEYYVSLATHISSLATEYLDPNDGDVDDDGDLDGYDNCLLVANPYQLDLDSDDFGNACDFEVDNVSGGCLDYKDLNEIVDTYGRFVVMPRFSGSSIVPHFYEADSDIKQKEFYLARKKPIYEAGPSGESIRLGNSAIASCVP